MFVMSHYALNAEDVAWQNPEDVPSEKVVKEAVKKSHEAVLESLMGGKMFEDSGDIKEDYLTRMRARSKLPRMAGAKRKNNDGSAEQEPSSRR